MPEPGETYRDRRVAKAERLRGWAEKREQVATATLGRDLSLKTDWAFVTQPGRIPERARIIARDERAYASLNKAGEMVARAAGIEHQLDQSIYSDDPDAAEALRARIAANEGKRAAWKAENAAYRKGDAAYAAHMGISLEQAATARARMDAGYSWCRRPHPAYETANLAGRIAADKKRLAAVEP